MEEQNKPTLENREVLVPLNAMIKIGEICLQDNSCDTSKLYKILVKILNNENVKKYLKIVESKRVMENPSYCE